MTGTQQALTSATLEAQMCVHPQNRALPNVFNDGNLAEPLIGTRVPEDTHAALSIVSMQERKNIVEAAEPDRPVQHQPFSELRTRERTEIAVAGFQPEKVIANRFGELGAINPQQVELAREDSRRTHQERRLPEFVNRVIAVQISGVGEAGLKSEKEPSL